MHTALSTDTYLVFEGDDRLNASVCSGDRVHEIVSQFDSPRVWRVTLDEFSRDVTDQFVPEPEADEWAGTSYDRAASAADAINDKRWQEWERPDDSAYRRYLADELGG